MEDSEYKCSARKTISVARTIINNGIRPLPDDTLQNIEEAMQAILLSTESNESQKTKAARVLLDLSRNNTANALALCKTIETEQKLEPEEADTHQAFVINIGKDMSVEEIEALANRLGGQGGRSV